MLSTATAKRNRECGTALTAPADSALWMRCRLESRPHKRPRVRDQGDDQAQQRRHATPGDAHAQWGLNALPPELVFGIALWLDPPDVLRVGATCRLFGPLLDDRHLWRRLFERSYGSTLYAGRAAGVSAFYQPPPKAGASDGSCLPPLPFAHARAAGYDWRWLCEVHYIESRIMPASNGSRHQYRAPTRRQDGEAAPSVYGVDIARDAQGIMIEWTEGLWPTAARVANGDDPNQPESQPHVILSVANQNRYFVLDDVAISRALEGVSDALPGRIVAHPRGILYEGPCHRGYAHGRGTVVEPGGRRWDAMSHQGITLSTVHRPNDGYVDSIRLQRIVPSGAENGNLFGGNQHLQHQQQQQQGQHDQARRAPRQRCPIALTVHYCNGDQVHMLHTPHAHAAIFWCSPTCVDPRFAGRRLECRMWAHALDIPGLALWPLDDATEPDSHARLFIEYARAGHCGWGPDAQQRAKEMEALGGVATVPASGGILSTGIPFAVVRSDEAQIAAARSFFENYA